MTTTELRFIPEGKCYSVMPALSGGVMAGERRFFRDDAELLQFLDTLDQTEQLRAIWEKTIEERRAFSVFV
jgi:hypothetical protein